MRLHPDDFELYSTFISKDYISSFKNKNQPVLDVLVEQKIPIVINNKSEVVSDRRIKKFPLEITAVLDKNIEKTKVHETSEKMSSPKAIINTSTDMESIFKPGADLQGLDLRENVQWRQ